MKGLPVNSRIFIIKTCRERPNPSDKCVDHMADRSLPEHIGKEAIKVKDMRYLKKFLILIYAKWDGIVGLKQYHI